MKEVENDIRQSFITSGGNPKILPKLPKFVGGDPHLMIGIHYNKYFPKIIFSLPNGLSIYESQFVSPDGSRGIVGGPHRIFSEIHKNLGTRVNTSAYFAKMVYAYQNSFNLPLDTSLLDIKETSFLFSNNEMMFDDAEFSSYKNNIIELIDDSKKVNDEVYFAKRSPKCLKNFEIVESAGTEVSYRGCPDCKNSGNIECISIQEEVEQAVIDKSVTVNLELGYTQAKLPFLTNPKYRLKTNDNIARSIYFGQVRKLNENPQGKEDVLKAENKLHDL